MIYWPKWFLFASLSLFVCLFCCLGPKHWAKGKRTLQRVGNVANMFLWPSPGLSRQTFRAKTMPTISVTWKSNTFLPKTENSSQFINKMPHRRRLESFCWHKLETLCILFLFVSIYLGLIWIFPFYYHFRIFGFIIFVCKINVIVVGT